MEDITDLDDMHVQRVCKDFEIKNVAEYYDLYPKNEAILLAHVFENVRMYLKNYQLDPAKFLSAPELTWKGALKKTEVKLELLTDIYMLLIVEKSITGGMCLLINQYEKADKKYCKDIGI